MPDNTKPPTTKSGTKGAEERFTGTNEDFEIVSTPEDTE